MNDPIPFVDNRMIVPAFSSQAAAAEQAREIALVQAMIMAACQSPRDEGAAMERIKIECQNIELASRFEYVYTRGSTLVQGPSIDLARAIVAHWGGIDYGWRVLDETQHGAEIMAFAIDFQRINRRSIVFNVRNWRETANGGYAITSDRDLYEHRGAQAMRRVRACLLDLLSKTAVDQAMRWCNETALEALGSKEQALDAIIAEFESLDVTEDMLSTRIGRKLRSAKLSELVRLHKTHTAIVDGMTTVIEEFPDRSHAKRARQQTQKQTPPSPPPAKKEPVEVDHSRYPNVPIDAAALPQWPEGLFYSKARHQWYDADGMIFDKSLHGWNASAKHPSISNGKFRARRGLYKNTEKSGAEGEANPTPFDTDSDESPPPPPLPPEDVPPPPEDVPPPPEQSESPSWKPGQPNEYAQASGR